MRVDGGRRDEEGEAETRHYHQTSQHADDWTNASTPGRDVHRVPFFPSFVLPIPGGSP
ncbi:MAG TPA: hypothetical protein VIX20_06750 [Ktedonobacteraceae bacterium]